MNLNFRLVTVIHDYSFLPSETKEKCSKLISCGVGSFPFCPCGRTLSTRLFRFFFGSFPLSGLRVSSGCYSFHFSLCCSFHFLVMFRQFVSFVSCGFLPIQQNLSFFTTCFSFIFLLIVVTMFASFLSVFQSFCCVFKFLLRFALFFFFEICTSCFFSFFIPVHFVSLIFETLSFFFASGSIWSLPKNCQ